MAIKQSSIHIHILPMTHHLSKLKGFPNRDAHYAAQEPTVWRSEDSPSSAAFKISALNSTILQSHAIIVFHLF